MIGDERAPSALRDRVVADLRPVRPLARPAIRALIVLALGGAVLAWFLAWRGHHPYGSALGPFWLLGPAALQLAVATLLAAYALARGIPGSTRHRRRTWGLVGLTAGTVALVTTMTWIVVPVQAPAGREWAFMIGCLIGPITLGLPMVVVVLWLASRALWLHPALTGGVLGLAVGLTVEATLHTQCPISDPVHVLAAHHGSSVVLALVGAVAATIWGRVAMWRAERLKGRAGGDRRDAPH